MPSFILVGDAGPQPYRPPRLDPTIQVDETHAAAVSRRTSDEEPGGGTYLGPERRHAQRAYEEANRRAATPEPAVLARQIMTPNPVTLPPDAPLDDAWTLTRERRIRHIPVIAHDRRLLGVLTDRDLMRAAPNPHHNPPRAGPAVPPTRVRDLMSANVIVATEDTPIHDVAKILVEQRIGCVPIVNVAYGLTGLITRTDILRCLINRAPLDLWI
jgi:acetoin utilization protein AcuB